MRHVVNPVLSWYEATAARGEAAEPLRASLAADVCVIGGGFAGLTTALEAQRRGLSTILIEGSRISCGASGRNGGFVSSGFALGLSDIVRQVGLQQARALYDLSRDGTEYVRANLLTHAPDLIMGHGWRTALRHRDNGSLKSYAEMMQRDFGEDVQHHTAEETRAVMGSMRYFESLSGNAAFHIHPLKYALLLGRLLRAAGGQIFENTRALNISREGSTQVVTTAEGAVRAKHVVVCVSSLDPKLHHESGRAVLPVATYVAVTEPLQQNVIRTSAALSDTRRAGDYYRLIDEGRLLWGGRITTRISEPSLLAERMKGDMVSVYPSLGSPRIDYAWAGLMGYALHKMPLIGWDGQGVWFATAFGGHGLNTTAMAGQLLARAMAGEDDAFRRFAAFGPKWAFGPLGRVGVQGAYWSMQLRDKWDEYRRNA